MHVIHSVLLCSKITKEKESNHSVGKQATEHLVSYLDTKTVYWEQCEYTSGARIYYYLQFTLTLRSLHLRPDDQPQRQFYKTNQIGFNVACCAKSLVYKAEMFEKKSYIKAKSFERFYDSEKRVSEGKCWVFQLKLRKG